VKARRPRWAVVLLVVLACAGCAPSRAGYVVPEVTVGRPSFARAVEAHTLSGLVADNRVEVLLNGDEIFPAMLSAIRGARSSITFANYLYEKGAIAQEFAEALAERCRAGVGVMVLVDAVGSQAMTSEARDVLERSGCHLVRFHPVNPLNVRRVNHRNHRRSLVVDGRVAFTGGTGIGDKWTGDGRREGHWRQTDVRLEGPIVRYVQAAFAETWREATGVLLGGDAYFPQPEPPGGVLAQSVKSSPGGGSPEAYTLFLLAIEGARSSIVMSTPYFVPDEGIATALIKAVARGVRVSVLVAGEADNFVDRTMRKASQKEFGRALAGGVKIYEYKGAMLHAKTLSIDGAWASVGSANLDNRSFALNHELNVVFYDASVAWRLEEIFRADLPFAREVTHEAWKRRGLNRIFELIVLPLRDML
jgi:cardiolipin synthase